MSTQPGKTLEIFPNPAKRDYLIQMQMPEFTCLCPKTGQPDFATLTLEYIPDERCIELKSLKLYIWSFRNEGHFHEAVTNRIVDDLVGVLQPRFLRLTARFFVRGGIFTNVVAEHRQPDWTPSARIDLKDFSSAPAPADEEPVCHPKMQNAMATLSSASLDEGQETGWSSAGGPPRFAAPFAQSGDEDLPGLLCFVVA